MRFYAGASEDQKKLGPLIPNQVLNKQECGVVAVGTWFGQLVYRRRGKLLTEHDIKQVIFLQSQKHKDFRNSRNVEANFDIYLNDGTVVEVRSFDRSTIEAALKWAPKKDIRSKYRNERSSR